MPDPVRHPPPAARARIPGLDGLRALAVVAVLLYHAEVPWVRGGFVGVDVFFVLRGYLVTTIVLEGFARTGSLRFGRFWSGRLRRLAPAQLALLVAVTVTVALWHPDELADLPGQVLAALTGTTNWYLIATEGSYFEQLGRPPVLRHLWSLAVELQFYLAFPPLLVLLLKRVGSRVDRIVAGLLAAIVVSTIYLAVLFDPNTDPTRAYFDTFARLAAPLTGAVLALVWRPRALRRGPVAQLGPRVAAAGGLALVGLLWIMHAADDRSALMYRGGFLVTALLSAVVVAAITHPGGVLGGRAALGNPALVAIGVRSYGLYLWHWPVFVLLRPRIDVGWSWGTTFVVRILVTVALTELCYRYVERPWHLRSPDASFAGIRRRLFQPSGVRTGPRLAALGAFVLSLAAVVILLVPHERTDAIAESLRVGEAALESHSSGNPTTTAATSADPVATTTTSLPPPGTGTVTLVGDSVMLGAAPDLLSAFGERANVDAAVARQAAELGPIIRQLDTEGRLGSRVVVQVGINGTVTEEDLRAIVDAAGGRPVYIINARVPRSWEEGNNAAVATVVPRLDAAEVIDWYQASDGHREWFLSDGVHLTAEGRKVYADTIRAAVDRVP
jgi:peptidoglycan/LPS O-acetylase OafA/YrhL